MVKGTSARVREIKGFVYKVAYMGKGIEATSRTVVPPTASTWVGEDTCRKGISTPRREGA
eukprot:5365679-Pleurochrysis_carterae.AAC.3